MSIFEITIKCKDKTISYHMRDIKTQREGVLMVLDALQDILKEPFEYPEITFRREC